MKTNQIGNESGLVTVIALLMVGMLTLIGLAALSTSEDEVEIAGNEMHDVKAFYAAEAGLERAAAQIATIYDSTGVPPSFLPTGEMDLENYGVTFSTTDDGAATPSMLTNGPLTGLNAMTKSFTITSTSHEPASRSGVQMSQTFEASLVPIFQFAVFYEPDLEIAPGPEMDLIGRVHSNGDLYIQSNNLLRMESYVTAAGDIIHGRKGPGSVGSGDVQIKDANGNYVSMQDGSGWLDSQDDYWLDSSVYNWQGTVQDASHGQERLEVPITGDGDAHNMIEPADDNPDSYELKASLKCIDGVWSQKIGGIWVDVTAGMTAAGIVSSDANKFYDAREGQDVDCVELDVDALYSSTYAPDNGIIYFSEEQTPSTNKDYPALRLVNGSELGDALTVASENPVYTLGDFNSTNKKAAAILADAITFLSASWDDAKGADSKYDRPASATTVNVSYLTGNVETTDSDYNGGFENLPRFLENWSGVDFNWAGSAVNLWNSLQANSGWSGSYYNPPTRNWKYDTDLDDPNNMPPGTPAIRIFERTGWKQEHVGFSQIHEIQDKVK